MSDSKEDHYEKIGCRIKQIMRSVNDTYRYICEDDYLPEPSELKLILVQIESLFDFLPLGNLYKVEPKNSSKNAKYYEMTGCEKGNAGNYKGAIEDFTKAIEINPSNAYLYIIRGFTKSELNNYQGAIEDYNQALVIDPNNEYALSNRGFAKLQLGDKESSLADYSKALESPFDADIYSKDL